MAMGETLMESTKPTVQVLVLGMPRTGTTSLRLALQILGYDAPYHWNTMCRNKMHPVLWEDFLDQKFNDDIPLTQYDFELCLKGFTNIGDWPCALFAKELVEAYPEAKVILSVRDSPEIWFSSFRDTIWRYQQLKLRPNNLWERVMYTSSGSSHRSHNHDLLYEILFNHTPFGNFLNEGKQWYVDHNQMLRDIVPKENLLEFNVKEGWEPLCHFLQKDLPSEDVSFPRANETERFQSVVDASWARYRNRRVRSLLASASVYLGIIAATFGVAHSLKWYYG